MKKISNMALEIKKYFGFNYDKFVDNALISKCSICSIKDGYINIYVNDPNVKIFINQIKYNILLEARKYCEIIDIRILDDKKNIVNTRNMKRQMMKEKTTFDDGVKYIKISDEEKDKILSDISKLEVSEEVKNHLYDIAEIYFKKGMEVKVTCPVCNMDRIDLIGDKCLICIQKELEYSREEAYYNLKKDPYILNNSKIYIDARRRILEEKVDKIFKYLDSKKEKADINIINFLFMDYAVYKAGSMDTEIQFLAANELRKKLFHYYKNKNINIPVLGENNE
ncbi:hypothetical protein [Streptobacillus moniliformis]|uniref:Uncharacterized protein n=1 Tax=Streptobacillus moniliformis (strain ATCC 14647 / DSM 12112 / NCTC 10651 / 9901) TaxID=519441 RepID=D1AW64_STRM9|nr:hypothetical protein [Streptobacillus moniliformis]ACZ00540.1 hypothetical protein Smon_0043 [Streptobacillus moniliformis DSM 12112]AVL43042.1 hypothetical protein CEP89_04030 [Streptobacillus moniliformis]QXW65308.1 hypothetical protein KX935_05760 [Streptobacillus moniliformis]SQA12813.1 Uncharacterised protein [Streptobacillus moniliformis]